MHLPKRKLNHSKQHPHPRSPSPIFALKSIVSESEKASEGDGKPNISNYFKKTPRFTPAVASHSSTTLSTASLQANTPTLADPTVVVAEVAVDSDAAAAVVVVDDDEADYGVDAERPSPSASVVKGDVVPERRSGRKTQVNAIVEVFLRKARERETPVPDAEEGEEVQYEDGEFEIGDDVS